MKIKMPRIEATSKNVSLQTISRNVARLWGLGGVMFAFCRLG
jgi:hypothetical protein